MPVNVTGRNKVADLDDSMPAAKEARLGTNLDLLIRKVNGLLNFMNGQEGLISTPGMSRGTTDRFIANIAFAYAVNGVRVEKAAVAAGTTPTVQTVTADRWALYRLSIQSGGTIVVTPAAGNVAGYVSEAAAVAAKPATPAGEVDMGYVTLKTMVGQPWIGGTDALAGGTTGNEASLTRYYNAALMVDPANIPTLS